MGVTLTRWALGAALAAAGGVAWAQAPVDGYKGEAIEALSALGAQGSDAPDEQPTPAAPTVGAPTVAAPPEPPTVTPSAPAAPGPASAEGRAPAAVGAPADHLARPQAAPQPAAPQGLPDDLQLKRDPASTAEPLKVGQQSQGVSGTGLALASVLLGLAALLAWWLQKRTQAKRAASGVDTTIEVLSSARVAGRFQISLVRVPGAILVLGASDKGLTLLTELPPDAIQAAPASRPPLPETRETRRARVAPAPDARPVEPPSVATRDTNEFLEQLLRAEQQGAAMGGDSAVEGEQVDIRRRLQRYQQSKGAE